MDNEIEERGFDIGEIFFRGWYWEQHKAPVYFYNVYCKVVDKKFVVDYMVYHFHVMSENGEHFDIWQDASYMVEHIREKAELFRLELTEEEKAKLLLMGL